MKQYVIVGNGAAAAGCMEGIRSRDPEGAVTVISLENHPVYCRPLISYYLEGKTSPERMNYRDADFYERMNCRVLYGRKAEHIQPEEHTVELDDGSVLPWDALCIAAGSSPLIPTFERRSGSGTGSAARFPRSDCRCRPHRPEMRRRNLRPGSGNHGL